MRLRKHLPTVLIAVVASAVTAGAPAIAHGVQHALFAHNADKVDGKHAVGSGATTTARKGKLVATSSTTGRLPNNIIAKVANADQLAGHDATEFMSRNLFVTNEVVGVDDNTTGYVSVECGEGKIATGGGATTQMADAPIIQSMPLEDIDRVPVGWQAIAVNNSGETVNISAFAICVGRI
jgi:hypothetical protein